MIHSTGATFKNKFGINNNDEIYYLRNFGNHFEVGIMGKYNIDLTSSSLFSPYNTGNDPNIYIVSRLKTKYKSVLTNLELAYGKIPMGIATKLEDDLSYGGYGLLDKSEQISLILFLKYEYKLQKHIFINPGLSFTELLYNFNSSIFILWSPNLLLEVEIQY